MAGGASAPFLGRTVLVTGAGSGIGRAVALAFARAGARLVASDIDPARLSALASALDREEDLAVLEGDVSDEAHANALAALAKARFGGLDIVCNIAGINDAATPADEMPAELWTRVLAVNLTGTFLVCRAALPLMIAAGSGVILNMASIAGLVGIAGPAYSASKHGVIGLTQSIAATYREDNIRCVAICPGLVPTALNEARPYATSARAVRRTTYRANRPPPGTPEGIAALCLFLAGDEAESITGSSIVADGGYLVS